jgi:DNA-binding CsgD family transcriptional regulator
MVSFGCGQRQGDFTRAQETQLRRVAPHLRRAHFLHARIRTLDDSPYRHLLDHAANTSACLALSREGLLVEANALGDLELHDAGTVELVGGRIRFRAAVAQRAFSLALRSGNPSAAIGLGAPEPAGTALLVDVSTLALPAASRPAHWLLFVPAGRSSRQRLESFAIEHGLSELEYRVPGLRVLGQEVGEIANELGHQQSTTRTVVKSLFRKTGAHRQTELVLRVLG